MTDLSTRRRLVVSSKGEAGPYIMVPVAQLTAVEQVLTHNRFSFWVDADAVAVNGGPAITVVNLPRGVRAADVQQLLDAID
jgi:hypothetical protein